MTGYASSQAATGKHEGHPLPPTREDQDNSLRGIIPVLPTPFKEDASLDLDSLDRLIEHALTWGAQGVAILGVASEVEKLTAEEYETIAERAARKVMGKLPLVVGVSAANTEAAVKSATIARRVGAGAVFAKAPIASQPETAEAEALNYFLSIAKAADLPVMVQNFALASGDTGVISMEALARVVRADHRIRYVKEETPPPAGNGKITQIRRVLGDGVTILSGLGGITLVDDLRRGATGNMPGSVLVRALVRVFEYWTQGKEEEADRLHSTILPLIVFRARWGNAVVTKAILQDLGVLRTATVRPPAGGSLDDQAIWELRRLERVLSEHL
jgi:4-hydroxy-tetrahydrodipicolinate synthase